MKKLLFAGAMILAATITNAQIKMPAPSSTQTIKQDFGLGVIELTYSRPSVKGRKIFGGHEPFDSLWRTGANAATRIKFTDQVEIGGKQLDSGSYVIYTIPGKDMWEVILNKGLTNWGTDGYKASEDVVRFKVAPMKMKTLVETMAMQFANVKPETCELHIMWEKTAIAIPITTNIKDRMRASIEKAMMGDKKPYWNAAQFYYEYDKDNAKALEAAKGAVDANPKAFWIWIYKAKIEKAMGDKTAAIASSQKSLELAREANNPTYIKDNEDLLKSLK